jgi:DNA-binding GntR family transcriptional regulator
MSQRVARGAPRQSATDRAYVYARQQIISGGFPPGELITEGQVSEALEISRTPVREAFMLLAAEGLLRLFPKRGALVVPVTWAEVGDIFEARLLVERWAVERVIQRGVTDQLVADLRAALDDERRALRRGTREFHESGRFLNTVLLGATGNAIVAAFHDSLMMRQLRMGQVAVELDEVLYPALDIIDHHRRLVDAIIAGDMPLALELVELHVARTRTMLRPRAPSGP